MRNVFARIGWAFALALFAGRAVAADDVADRVITFNDNGAWCWYQDPRVLRGGNLPSTFNVAHWMRDRRLSFTRSDSHVSVTSLLVQTRRSSGSDVTTD